MEGLESFPDISEWYTPERIAAEEVYWEKNATYLEYAQRILKICRTHNLHTVAEVGCGTGWVPFALDPSLKYLCGIDKNPHMLERAKAKNPKVKFVQRDIRTLYGSSPLADLVCSFEVLKHFSLTEWPLLLRGVLSLGSFGLFTQSVAAESKDIPGWDEEHRDGFHGIWVSRSDVYAAVENAGHEIIEFDSDFRFDEGVGASEVMITTRRKQ